MIKTVSRLWNRIHGGGIYRWVSQVFLYKLSNAWQRICIPTKIPRGSAQICHTATGSFFASFRKLYLDSFAKLRKNTTCFDSANHNDQQMALWHHRDSGRRSRTKLHQEHLFMTWSIHTTDGFWHVFGSMGFLQLEDEKFTNWKKLQSRSFLDSSGRSKESE